jgi:rhamnogalacturonyl hydrolase YesR
MLLLGHATNIVGTQQNTKYRSGPHWTISGEGKLAYTTYISESIGYVFKDYTRIPRIIRIIEAKNVDSVKAAPLLSTVTNETLISLSTYRVVMSLAEHILSKAEYDHGYKWATRMDDRIFYNAVLGNGAAGVGLFLLLLYNMTAITMFLDYARGAANWIMVSAEYEYGGLTWPHYDLEAGWYLTPDKSVAGIAKFFLEMYKTTGDKEYLKYAEATARWIINTGILCQGDQCYVEYNPYYQAAFGVYSYVQRDVGTLLIELYIITRNQAYLDYAKMIGNWILATSECYGNYCTWYDDRRYGKVYAVEGVAVLADYLYDLYLATGIVQYRDVADKMVNWIESIGVKVSADSIKFPSWDEKFRSIVCGDLDRLLSIRTPGEILIKSYEVTGNKFRLATAKMFANWLESISVETGRVNTGSFTRISRAIPYIEGEKSYSPWVNAIIFNFLIKLYSIERDQKYIDLAASLLNYIEDYMKENLQKLDPIFYQGASGIGYYLASALLTLRITPTTTLTHTTETSNPSLMSQLSPMISPIELGFLILLVVIVALVVILKVLSGP